MRRIVGVIAVAVVCLGVSAPSAGAAGRGEPRVSAHLACDHGTVRLVESYKLPLSAKHAEWLNVTFTHDGLKLRVGWHVRMIPSSTYISNDIVDPHAADDVVVRWTTTRHGTISWKLPTTRCT